MEDIKDFLKKVADCLNEHWIWKTIILFLPSIYLPVLVKYLGEELHLSDSVGNLTKVGSTFTVILYFLVLGVNVLSNYKSKRDKENDFTKEEEYEAEIKKYKKEIEKYEGEIQGYVNTLDVYIRLLNVIGKVCDIKLEAIYNYINSSLENNEFRKPFNETVYPEKQLKSIAREMKTCLSEITSPPVSNISVSMAYEIPGLIQGVHWLDPNEVAQCMKLEKLRKNKITAFYKVYSGQSNYIFINDKQKAANEGNYVFDKKDNRHHNIGSLICDGISIEDENGKIARIILTISTYGYKFTDSENKEILENMSAMIEEVILQQFEKRIRIELALLYIKKQYNRNNQPSEIEK